MTYSQYEGINIGSGPHYAQGWYNIDAVEPDTGTSPDMLVDIMHLAEAIPQGSFKRAYVGHVLEHIEWRNMREAIMNIAHTVESGGQIVVVGPCLIKANGSPRSLIEAILPDPRIPDSHWGHKWCPTTDLTLEAMRIGGLLDVGERDIRDVVPPEWPNPSTASWQVAAIGFAQ